MSFRLAFRLTGNRQDAEDLRQEAVVLALTADKANAYNGGSDATDKSFVLRIVRRQHISAIRQRKRVLQLDKETDERSSHLCAQRHEEGIASTVWSLVLDQALAKLPNEQRAVIILIDFEEFSYREVADIMQVPVGTVRSRRSRGIMKLRQLLQETSDQT